MTNLTKEYQIMTDEEFQNIYSSEKFRNEVAFAHKCCDSNGNLKYYGTCTHPNKNRRQVTPEQIKTAQELREKRKTEVLKENKNKLLFVGMGMNYEPRYKDDVCNHRIRTEFLNANGRKFFIEFGTGRGEDLRVDHSIDRDLEDKNRMAKNQPYNNFGNLERRGNYPKYTKENILQMVNDVFSCNFKEVVIDYYNISCEGVICESPKK